MRATLALLAAAIVLVTAVARLHLPLTLAMPGPMIAMISALAVADRDAAEERVTLLFGIIAAAAAAVMSTFVARSSWLSGAALCAVVFAAVIGRARGSRGMGVGMLGFMGYFFALFVHATPAQLPALIGSIAVGGAVAYVTRFWVVPERPRRVRESVLGSFRARIQLLFDDVAEDAAAGARSERRWKRIRRAIGRVNEAALGLEEAVGGGAGETPAVEARGWLGELLRAEASIGMLAHAVHQLAEQTHAGPALARTIDQLQRWIRRGDPAAREATLAALGDALAAAGTSPARDMHALWWRVQCAIPTLVAARPWAAFPDVEPTRSRVSLLSFRPGGGGVAGISGRPNLRLAVQATVAAALAVVVGRAISPARWYWAVLAAFVVYVRAATVAETVSRAWQRSLGTIVGVVAGLTLAALVGSDRTVAIALGLVAVFVAYYMVRISYAAMIAAFTAVISLLYAMLHQPVPGLLELRLYETLAGVGVGVAVSALVFPARSTHRIRALVADVERAAAETIAHVTARTAIVTPDAELQDAIRHVDRALAELRNAVRPLWGPTIPIEPPSVTRAGRAAADLAYMTRSFALAPPVCEDPQRALVRRTGDVLARSCLQLAEGRAAELEEIPPLLAALGCGDAPPPPIVVLLEDLASAVSRLARRPVVA